MVINLKILFKNKTKYDKATYKKFLEFHSNKYHFSYVLFTTTIIFFILLCITLQISYKYYSLAIITCIAFTCFCLYRYFHPISVVTKELNGETIKKEKSITFKFYEKYFKVQDDLQLNIIKYFHLRKVFETKYFFYLYIDRTHAFIINKKDFLFGKSTDFSKFIKRKCFLRFKKVE